MPGTSPKPHGIARIPWARPWDAWGRPWDRRARPWDSQGRPGDPWGRPWDPWGPPGTPHGPQKQQYLDKYTTPEALDCCVRTRLLGPVA